MIYPATFEQEIGFDRLREQVAARCTMRAARERLAAEGFSTSARKIERRLALADEMRLLLDMEHDFPGGEYPDVDYIVAKLRVEGSFLDVEEVVTQRRALAAIGGIVSFIISREERYPALPARTRGVAAFPEIVQRSDGILVRFGQVKDIASPALLVIRRSIREREGQAAKRLQAELSAAKGAGIECFPGARAVNVPRSRFFPVKTTSDLFLLRSDAIAVDEHGNVALAPERQGNTPVVDLDSKLYKLVDSLDGLGLPSLIGMD